MTQAFDEICTVQCQVFIVIRNIEINRQGGGDKKYSWYLHSSSIKVYHLAIVDLFICECTGGIK